jgi:hypothetical protein
MAIFNGKLRLQVAILLEEACGRWPSKSFGPFRRSNPLLPVLKKWPLSIHLCPELVTSLCPDILDPLNFMGLQFGIAFSW